MDKAFRTQMAGEIMLDFAENTGVIEARYAPQRYLWTDAFAVCNLLELYRRSLDESWMELAKRLVDQVHHVLGRHRPDGPKKGWISGLSEDEGELHPTRGGLRIGKRLPERAPDEPLDEHLEWERDGQYYHYLTKWMHALQAMARVTGDATYLRWAMEMAQAVHAAFRYPATPDGSHLALHWKMSVELNRPQVRSAGQHDPVDGFTAYSELQSALKDFAAEDLPDLSKEVAELAAMSRGKFLTTDDTLGIGGLLCDAAWLVHLTTKGDIRAPQLLQEVLQAALTSIDGVGRSFLDIPSRYRLAFRELGLSIGLRGLRRLGSLVQEYPEAVGSETLYWLGGCLENFNLYLPLTDKIEIFWIEEMKRRSGNWKEHRDINMVMLATSLVPDQFLKAG